MSNASRRRQGLVALGCVFAVAVTAGAGANGQKFYPDDPITRIVDAEDASGVQEREIDLEYRHPREPVLLARRPDAERPRAEPQHDR